MELFEVDERDLFAESETALPTRTMCDFDEVKDFLNRIKGICEEHRGDENYFPNGRLVEVIRLIDGEI